MSNDLKLLKQEIYQKELAYDLLESVGCDNLRFNQNRIDGSRPTGDSPKGFSVFLDEDLTGKVWTRSVPTTDIIDLISYFKFGKKTREEIKNCIPKSKNYIVETLKLEGYKNNRTKDLPDYNFHLRKLKKHKKKERNEVISESVLNGFVMLPHIKLYNEIPDYDLLKQFEIGYDLQTERIIFTYRNRVGGLVGVRGRATRKEEEDKAKYLPIYNFSKSLELYNLHRAIPFIVKYKRVLLFEGEKSAIQSTRFNYPNCVSFMGSYISEEQASLVKSIHPELEFVICMDKDKTVEEVRNAAKFLPQDKTYAIFDVDDYLECNDDQIDSPVDKGKEVFDFLYKNHCYKIFPK